MAAEYKTLLGLVREFVEKERTTGGWGVPDELMQRARAAIAPSAPKNDVKLLHMGVNDACCTSRFQDAGRKGKLDNVDRWECPRCGAAWRAKAVPDEPNVRHWDAENTISIL